VKELMIFSPNKKGGGVIIRGNRPLSKESKELTNKRKQSIPLPIFRRPGTAPPPASAFEGEKGSKRKGFKEPVLAGRRCFSRKERRREKKENMATGARRRKEAPRRMAGRKILGSGRK